MKNINWNFNVLLSIGSFLIGWMSSWVVEYFVAAVFGFPTSICIGFVINLNILVVAIIIAVLGCMAGSFFMNEFKKEN